MSRRKRSATAKRGDQRAAETGDQFKRSSRQALRASVDDAEALSQSITLAASRGRWREALRLAECRLAVQPVSPEAHFQRGVILQELGRPSEALAEYEKALDIQPDYADAIHNRGTILIALERFDGALEHWDAALKHTTNNPDWHFCRAYALAALGRFPEALVGYDQVLRLRPSDAIACNNRGNVLKELGRFAEALECFASALALRPQYAEAYSNRGNVLKELGRHKEALAEYDRAIALQPMNARTHYNRGHLLYEQGRLEEATAALRRALRLQPTLVQAEALLVYLLAQLCDWSEPRRSRRLLDLVRAGAGGIPPFILLSQSSTQQDQLRCAQRWAKEFQSARRFPHPLRPRTTKTIRLGYLSADFRDHPISYLIAELLELHSRERFEIIAYSYGHDDGGQLRRRIARGVDRFVELRHHDLSAAAKLIYEDKTDILVDLMGYSRGARTGILSFRPAPIQVNFLGYPSTMGSDFIDYILVDPKVAPGEDEPYYREKLVQLPHCYQPNDTKRQIAVDSPSRATCGLPPSGIVFCCFNASYKLTAELFAIWMRLLQSVPDSVLWLLEENSATNGNLRREAEARGIAAARLVFAPRLPLEAHLARHRLADLCLDTLPYNAHTTASDALWAGVPLITCRGATFAGRVATSLLSAIDLPELIASDLNEYEALVLGLAGNKVRLADTKAKLVKNRMSTHLFDTKSFRGHIESAYETMWQRWRHGEQPKGFAIAP